MAVGPINSFDWFWRGLVAGLLVMFFFIPQDMSGAPGAAPPPPLTGSSSPDGETLRQPVGIESVEVLVLESFPMQLTLQVTGWIQDGCEYPVQVEQAREGSTVKVSIFREMPADIMCPMVVVEYSEAIAIDGGFEGGTYTIEMNDYVTTVDL